MIKNIVLGVGAVAAVSGVGVAVAHQNSKYQNNKVHQAKVAQKKAEDAQKVASDKQHVLQLAYDQSRLECEKGLAAYAKLAPALQKTTPKPACTPAVVR